MSTNEKEPAVPDHEHVFCWEDDGDAYSIYLTGVRCVFTYTGPTPTDLFLASIASCFVLALAWAARHADKELPGLQVRVVGTYTGPRFSRIEIEVSADAPGTVVDDLLPEAERVCYVTNSLRNPPELHVERVVKSAPSPRKAPSADGGRSP
jgi:uncharacterized OsmC-like protein